MNTKPISKKQNIVVQELETEVLIYDLKINKAYCLNQTSGLVYQLCDGKNSVAEISNLMSKKLKTLVSEDFVWLALDGLKKDNLLEKDGELANHFAGLSRREVIRKIGLGSMIALPLISSVIAPTAVYAASCGGTNPPGTIFPSICFGPSSYDSCTPLTEFAGSCQSCSASFVFNQLCFDSLGISTPNACVCN